MIRLKACFRLFAGLLGIFFCLLSEASAETIRLSTFSDNAFSLAASRVITEAYHQAGYDAEIVFLPGKRALKTSSEGIVDGEVSRVYAIGDLFPTLIRVEPPYMTLRLLAFVVDPSIKINQLSDLAKFKIGSIRGVVFSDKLTEGMRRVHAKSPPHLLELLIRGRVDVIIATELEMKVEIAKSYPDSGVIVLDPPLLITPIYHYIHESKSQLVPKMATILKQMNDSGQSADIIAEFLIDHASK